MAKNQKHLEKLKAKLKATLNQSNISHGNTTPKPTTAPAVQSNAKAATATANKSSANPKVQKLNKKPPNHTNGSSVPTSVPTQTAKKSAQPKQKPLPKVVSNGNAQAAAPKVSPVEVPKKKPNIIFNQKINPTSPQPNQPLKNDKKKKTKEKQKKPTATAPVDTKPPHKNQPMQKGKRKLDQVKTNTNTNTQAKRLKCDRNGFIETNNDSDVEIQVPIEKKQSNKTKKKKLKKNQDKSGERDRSGKDTIDPSVKVIDVDGDQLNGLDDHSDSEADSYIDRFFQGDDNEFNENRIYSVDEIETANQNFLAKASGVRTQSDADTSSSEDTHVQGSDSDSNSNNGMRKITSNDLEKYSWSGNGSDGEEIDDSDYDDEDEDDDMYYGSDSDVSLGSVVDSDDLDDTYECESSEESVDGYEMNSSYEDDSDEYECGEEEDDDDDSDHSNYSYSDSDSGSSRDTYDEFLHSRHYDSSNDDHDYTDSQYDDLRIAQGTAITHKITDKRIKIFENDTESRIIELPKTDSDDEKCVDLIPITVSRTKFLRIERQKQIAEQAKLDEKQRKDEAARLAHEKAIADYYNMDKLAGDASKHDPNDTTNRPTSIYSTNSVKIVKCPKNFKHFTLNLMDVDDEQARDEDVADLPYPKTKAKNVIAVKCKLKPNQPLNKSKTQANKVSEMDVDATNSSGQAHEVATTVDRTAVADDNVATTPSKTKIAAKKKDKTPPTKSKPIESQFFNSINSRHVLLLLRNELHFHGSLHVKLIAGKVTAFGYQLQHNKTVTLHSPRGHGFINLITAPSRLSDQQQYAQALDTLAADFYAQDIAYVKTQMKCASDAILILEREQTNKGVNMIDRYMRETMFPNINAFNNDSPFYSSEFVLHCKFFTEPDNGLVHNEQWSTIALHNTTKLVAIGGKGVGKSTFIRYLINANIGKFPKFLFIDLDIGQPELFVPQTVSATVVTEPILGPGYLKNVKPSKAVLFGDINVLPNPIKYLRCVLDIFEFCASTSELSSIPWIINTMGYSRGFGSELIACILKIVQPTDVVQIQSRMNADNFVQIMNANVVNAFKFNVFEREMASMEVAPCHYKMHTFDAMSGKSGRKHVDMTAKDLRYAMILAKLGNCLKYNTDWLTSVKPFEASLNDLDVLITNGEEVAQADYLDLLNGNLVYLCWRQPEQTNDIIDCHGIGIVRSVDAQTGKLYLLATISLAEMQHVNVLAIGAIPLPSAVFLNQHMQVRGAVPYVYNSDNFIGSKQVAQHIFRAGSKFASNKPIKLMED